MYAADGSIAELKGFEVKRRGELEFIRTLQREIFPTLVQGSSKREAYALAAQVGQRFRHLLKSRAAALSCAEDVERLVVTRKVLAKSVQSQGAAKSMAITTARRLAELLKDPSHLTDAPLATHFVVLEKPVGTERTARAVPIQLFHADSRTRANFLSRWLGIPLSEAALCSDMRQLIDWSYYAERLDVQLQKIVSIPALKQGLENPIPDIEVPAWLRKQQAAADPRQRRLEAFFKTLPPQPPSSQASTKSGGASQTAPAPAPAPQRSAVQTARRQKQLERRRQIEASREERRLWREDFREWLSFQRVKWRQLRGVSPRRFPRRSSSLRLGFAQCGCVSSSSRALFAEGFLCRSCSEVARGRVEERGFREFCRRNSQSPRRRRDWRRRACVWV